MNFVHQQTVVFLLCLFLTSCQAQTRQANEELDTVYSFQTPSRDGTGKYYMGREIAHVMGHLGAPWLERPERDQEENTTQAINNMELSPTDMVADIGAGSGYYTFRIAEILSEGKVFAVDIQPEMLSIMRQKIQEEQIENVELVKGTEKNPNLPPESVDVILFVDVYHELAFPREVLTHLVKALRANGRLILLEYRMEDPKVPIKRLHKMSLRQASKEMEAVGLRLKENLENLPWQHFMIFEKDN